MKYLIKNKNNHGTTNKIINQILRNSLAPFSVGLFKQGQEESAVYLTTNIFTRLFSKNFITVLRVLRDFSSKI